MNEVYKRRRELVWKLASILECNYDQNAKGLFVWARLPNGIKNSEKFINHILLEKNIFITPGMIFGSNGEGYIRFSCANSDTAIDEAISRMKQFFN